MIEDKISLINVINYIKNIKKHNFYVNLIFMRSFYIFSSNIRHIKIRKTMSIFS